MVAEKESCVGAGSDMAASAGPNGYEATQTMAEDRVGVSVNLGKRSWVRRKECWPPMVDATKARRRECWPPVVDAMKALAETARHTNGLMRQR